MVGQALASHLAPEGRETVLGRIEARIRGDAVPVANEVEALRRDGSRVWLEAAAALVEWEGEPATLVCCTDVSERRRRVAAEREADSLRSVTMLANAAAHEINNPLTIIAGNVQLLGGKLSERADLQDHVRRTERAVQRIVEMVGHMQHITRLEPLADLDTGSVPTLDIRRSAGPAPGGGPADPGPSAT
jgi:nitrogen-specific signal transduction histidine kinase